MRDAALAIIRSHKQRLRAVIHLANYEGPEVIQDRVNIDIARKRQPLEHSRASAAPETGHVYLDYTYYINILEDAYGC